MTTALTKHLTPDANTSTHRVAVSRAMGADGGKVKPLRAYFELRYVYTIDPANGDETQAATALFPSGKYTALDSAPTWAHHRFVGWFPLAAVPSADIPSTTGEIEPEDSVVFERSTVYAHWQLPTTVTFDATSGGGEMPGGWMAPDYYAGQTYGELPKPTHPTLNFTGWYTQSGARITAASIVPQGGATLVARYAAQSFSVDLDDQWQLSASQTNPDPSAYDGVYESFSNYHVANGYAKMYVRLQGYTNFRIYIRSNAESNYDYTIAFNPDIDVTSNPSYMTAGAKTSTRGNQRSGQSISDYTPVDYTLDGGEHFILIVYRKDLSADSGTDRGYVLIPKEQ